jgi:hypothetical protein
VAGRAEALRPPFVLHPVHDKSGAGWLTDSMLTTWKTRVGRSGAALPWITRTWITRTGGDETAPIRDARIRLMRSPDCAL